MLLYIGSMVLTHSWYVCLSSALLLFSLQRGTRALPQNTVFAETHTSIKITACIHTCCVLLIADSVYLNKKPAGYLSISRLEENMLLLDPVEFQASVSVINCTYLISFVHNLHIYCWVCLLPTCRAINVNTMGLHVTCQTLRRSLPTH